MGVTVKAMGLAGVAIAAAGFALSPAASAVSDLMRMRAEKPVSLNQLGSLSSFTPATRDSRLASAYARIAASAGQGGFRFTPTSGSMSGRRSITIAVRAEDGSLSRMSESPVASLGVTPVAYNLGVSRGWKRFALSDSLGTRAPAAVVEQPIQAENFTLNASQPSRFSTRVQQVEPAAGLRPGTDVKNKALDVASSYALTRNLNVTAGIRYRGASSRLAPLTDEQQDNQAVYVGTIFKF